MSNRSDEDYVDAIEMQLRRLRPRGASLDLEAILAAARQPKPDDLIPSDRHQTAVPHTLGGGFSPWYTEFDSRFPPAPPESHSMNEESFSSLLARVDVLVQANRFAEAIVPLQQAEQIARRDGKESDLAKALARKSLCLAKLGQTSEPDQAGAGVDEQVLRESLRQIDLKSFASLMANAAILIKDERNLEAIETLESAEAIARRTSDEKGLVSALSLKSRCLYKLGRNIDAERANTEAVVLELKGSRRFAKALETQQKYAEAEKIYREALRICEKNFAMDHRETATCRDSLAANLRRQSRFHEALTFAKLALEIRLRLFGLFHDHTAHSLWNIGLLYTQLSRFEEADDALGKSRVVREKLFGDGHPCVADSIAAIASLRRHQGRFDEAISLGERCLKIREDKLGPDHPLTGAAKHNLALSTERQPPLQGGESADADGTSCEPCGGDPPRVDVTDRSKLPRQQHAVGYWIVMSAVASIAAAFLVLWLKPELIAGVSVVVAICGAMIVFARMTGRESPLEDALKRNADRLKGLGASREGVDPDKVRLGRASDAARGRIDDSSDLHHLDVAAAVELVGLAKKLNKETLDLDNYLSLSQSAADVIAEHAGTLKLNGVEEFRSKLAKSLVRHVGRLELNGVNLLTEEAAANIRKHEGDLCFSGLCELLDAVAGHFAHHRGRLELNGVRTMTEDSAKKIIRHRGLVQLHQCKLISSATRQILKSSPNVEFPGDDQAA